MFADAVDDGTAAPGDAELDAQLALVARLREAGRDRPGPGRDARSRIAAKIAAGAERQAGTRPGPPPTDRRPRRRAVAPVLAAAASVLIAFGGVAVLLSDDALPGDTLYQVKRARETASVTLTLDRQDRAFKQLEHAALRVDELADLGRPAGADEAAYATALADFDRDVHDGVRGVVAVATAGDGGQFDVLRSWSADQAGRLAAVEVPAASAPAHAAALDLLDRVDERAATLAARLDCRNITIGVADDLGALPAADDCAGTSGEDVTAALVPDPPAADPGADGEASGTRAPTQAAQPSGSRVPASRPSSATPTPPSTHRPSPAPNILEAPPTSTRPPATATPPPASSTRPPVLDLPPLLPGLPPIRIG